MPHAIEPPAVPNGNQIAAQSPSCITIIFISNLHCPTCVDRIQQLLRGLHSDLHDISISIINHSLTFHHSPSTNVSDITEALDAAGFEIHSVFDDHQTTPENIPIKARLSDEWSQKFDQAISKWKKKWKADYKSSDPPLIDHPSIGEPAETEESSEMGKKRRHAEHCAQCRAEAAGLSVDGAALPLNTVHPAFVTDTATSQSKSQTPTPEDLITPADVSKSKGFVVVETALDSRPYHADLSISGMTCSACSSAITRAVQEKPYVRSINVSLLTNSAVVVFDGGKEKADDIVETIEDTGFDVTLEKLEQEKPKTIAKPKQQQESDLWRGQWAIGGMTCSACSGSITSALKLNTWIQSVDINLLSNSGTIVFHGKGNADVITGAIEDVGFDATLDSVVAVSDTHVEAVDREVFFEIEGMYCHHCPERIIEALREDYGTEVEVEKEPSTDDPIMKLRYTARAPVFTIRSIFRTINAVDPAFFVSIHHPPTIEDRAKAMHARERKRILLRLALSITAAIPAFIVGIVCMQLLMKNSAIRMYMMHPVWAGQVSRAEWVLFILATPIFFFAADVFHKRAFHELKALWRPGSPTPIAQRFYRFGSMNMLMSLGTSIAYFSSIAELGIEATTPRIKMPGMFADDEVMPETSNYFDSVIFLTMFLLLGRFIEAYSKAKTGDAVTSLGNLRPSEAILVEEADVAGRKIAVDLLDVGDVVLVPQGTSPPFDGLVIDGSSKFDESSLTGESRPVNKDVGDQVFSGTVNKGRPVSVKLTSVAGSSMLDNIIKIVREGQTKRAPIERAADMITSHFVPVVVAIGITTWLVWLTLGISGALPQSWIDGQTGGWPLWSLRFAIAVFVIACPCGIGLAAPTALFVGGGMAAKHGILVKGGGEAFQEASTLDCIVFDKTGTLTEGGEPAVTDHYFPTTDDEKEILGMTKRLEENSSHPVAKAIVDFCGLRTDRTYPVSDIEEIPGKGMSGQFKLDEGRITVDGKDAALDVQVVIGNEALMADHHVAVDESCWRILQSWKLQGKSVVLVALRVADPFADSADAEWRLTAMYAVADALRPEAKGVVEALQSRGVAVWMLSGDNQTTAEAIGAMVGIGPDNIIAGVLPDQKAEKIQYLQKTLPHNKKKPRATVAMVGDGINDSPALTMADVGIAIGSGSDVAISSAEFILIKSELSSILHLIDLSRVVFRRVWFNFMWALIYNIICLPVAAGVFFPITDKNGNHVRLDPVWASLAMAMSSISVICSSLLLRANVKYLGFRAAEYGRVKEEKKGDDRSPERRDSGSVL
ncbi:putative copper-transporting ATPase HMA5 [Venturia nashicola]|uniref:Putative copper-transporting ATPase HMA5 n=1 Tax=Venturia nashicola TaxID=86259 RepID=A0A4Z1P8C4_9PEZI|nr:putative copper-transporting ATPase HMA5 [Venturia nashicola]TLD25801.1 putative copper-transporting ATPase HMA5 [Venturia nashicola]